MEAPTTTGQDTSSTNGSDSGSLLQRLREQRDRVAQASTVPVLISGYRDPRLLAIYRLLGEEEQKAIEDNVKRHTKNDDEVREWLGQWFLIDIMINAVTGFEADVDGRKVPITDADGAPVVSFGGLAEAMLGVAAGTEREGAVLVFAGNPIAARKHGSVVMDWMADTSIGVDREFLGEA